MSTRRESFAPAGAAPEEHHHPTVEKFYSPWPISGIPIFMAVGVFLNAIGDDGAAIVEVNGISRRGAPEGSQQPSKEEDDTKAHSGAF